METPLEVKAHLTNEKIQFTGVAGNNPAITFDYTPPLGDGKGYTPLEMLLMSLAVCSGTTNLILLRGMKKTVSGVSVRCRGIRRETHPTCFEQITLDFTFTSPDATTHDVQRAMELSEKTYCPVWAMLKNNVEILPAYTIIAQEEVPKSLEG